MHNKEERTTIYDFHNLTDHYQAIEVDGRTVAESLTDILKFLKEGRAWNKANRGGEIDGDFEERIEFIGEMKVMFEETEVNDDEGLFLKQETHEINLKPLIGFINEKNLRMISTELEMAGERMLDVLHDQNVYYFRENTKKLNSIKLMFDCMQHELS